MAIGATVDEAQIRAYVGDVSFDRGWPYFQQGAIFDMRQQGATLKARCRGSSGGPYRVEATFADGEIAHAHCSCPVGGGGGCKHVAALLLTWQAKPKSFAPVEETDRALERRSKAELIALIQQMLRQEPDLEVLLETPLPVPGKRARAGMETYRRQAALVFERADWSEWGVESEIAEKLAPIQEIGDRFLEQQDFPSAAAVYRGVALEVLANLETFNDQEGDLAGVVSTCVAGLGRCLASETEDQPAREGIFETLLDVIQADLDAGGTSLGDEAYDFIVERSTPEERRKVTEWVRERAADEEDAEGGTFAALLFDLEADTLDDEEFLRRSRALGRTVAVVDRLLTLGRRDEALAEVAGAQWYDIIPVANVFVQHGEEDVAEQMVREQAAKKEDSRALQWLQARCAARGDTAGALEWAERLFRKLPTLDGYQELRGLAGALDQWPALRSRLRQFLEPPQYHELRIRVALEEGEIDHALELVHSQPRSPYGYFASNMRLEVARAVHDTRPRAAMELYRKEAEERIENRGRDNYREACRLLTHVRALYDRLGEGEEWTRYLAALREKNRTLRALQEELTTAKL